MLEKILVLIISFLLALPLPAAVTSPETNPEPIAAPVAAGEVTLTVQPEADTPQATTAVPVEPTTPEPITAEEAVLAALGHSALKEDEITERRVILDRDDGILTYDVDFRSGDYEYDYEIHAITGQILEWDKEYDPLPVKDTTPPITEEPSVPQVTEPPVTTPTTPEKIGNEAAIAIALKKAGLTRDQIRDLEWEYDKDDGVLTYDLEFRSGKYEYDFEIHAYNGEILEWDKEYDD